jgi:DNA-directed RNA polymerase specialized sigma24 family protein
VPVSDDQIRSYDPHVASLARKYVGRAGAELDDLVQEGRIAVWQSLEDLRPPSTEFIEFYMRRWIQTLRKQTGE